MSGDSPQAVVVMPCPWCGRMHSSDAHDEGWYFVCCGFTRVVWRRDEAGVLRLVAVPEDEESDA